MSPTRPKTGWHRKGPKKSEDASLDVVVTSKNNRHDGADSLMFVGTSEPNGGATVRTPSLSSKLQIRRHQRRESPQRVQPSRQQRRRRCGEAEKQPLTIAREQQQSKKNGARQRHNENDKFPPPGERALLAQQRKQQNRQEKESVANVKQQSSWESPDDNYRIPRKDEQKDILLINPPVLKQKYIVDDSKKNVVDDSKKNFVDNSHIVNLCGEHSDTDVEGDNDMDIPSLNDDAKTPFGKMDKTGDASTPIYNNRPTSASKVQKVEKLNIRQNCSPPSSPCAVRSVESSPASSPRGKRKRTEIGNDNTTEICNINMTPTNIDFSSQDTNNDSIIVDNVNTVNTVEVIDVESGGCEDTNIAAKSVELLLAKSRGGTESKNKTLTLRRDTSDKSVMNGRGPFSAIKTVTSMIQQKFAEGASLVNNWSSKSNEASDNKAGKSKKRQKTAKSPAMAIVPGASLKHRSDTKSENKESNGKNFFQRKPSATKGQEDTISGSCALDSFLVSSPGRNKAGRTQGKFGTGSGNTKDPAVPVRKSSRAVKRTNYKDYDESDYENIDYAEKDDDSDIELMLGKPAFGSQDRKQYEVPKPAFGSKDGKQYEVARIAVGTQVQHCECHVTFTTKAGLKLSWKDQMRPRSEPLRFRRNAATTVEEISIFDYHLREVKYYIPDELDQDDAGERSRCVDNDYEEDFQTSFLSMNVEVSRNSPLSSWSTCYKERGGIREKYIVVEFRSNDELKALLNCMESSSWGVFVTDQARLSVENAPDYAKTLLEDMRRDRRKRKNAATKKKENGLNADNTDDKILLVFPFDGDKLSIENAAKGLTEANKLLSRDVKKPEGSSSGDDASESDPTIERKRPRAHYVTIRTNDYERLEPGQFLNDSLIDFWIQWIARHDDRLSMHFFTSHFYTTLEEEGVAGVTNWTKNKNIDIFEKKMIFIPINMMLHWSLCVVVNPGSIVNTGPNAPVTQNDCHPVILFFDSLKAHRKGKVAKQVRLWLNSEWSRLQKSKSGDEKPFTDIRIKVVDPKIPYQNNSWDCGVFVCLYAFALYQIRNQPFLAKDIAESFRSLITNSNAFQFSMKDIRRLRLEMKQLIKALSLVYIPWRETEDQKENEECDEETAEIMFHKPPPLDTRASHNKANSLSKNGDIIENTAWIDLGLNSPTGIDNLSSLCLSQETSDLTNVGNGHKQELQKPSDLNKNIELSDSSFELIEDKEDVNGGKETLPLQSTNDRTLVLSAMSEQDENKINDADILSDSPSSMVQLAKNGISSSLDSESLCSSSIDPLSSQERYRKVVPAPSMERLSIIDDGSAPNEEKSMLANGMTENESIQLEALV